MKSNLFLLSLCICALFPLSKDQALAADVTVSPVSGENAQITINNAIAAAGSSGTVTIKNGTYEFVGHIVTKSGVNIVGESRDGVILKISKNAKLGSYSSSSTINSGGWGGNDDAATDGAIIMAWSNNVKISNLTLDGSCGDYFPCAANDRGHAEYNLMNIRAENVTVNNVRFIRGKSDGIIARGSNIEVSNCVFNMIGHDGCNTYGVNNLKFHHNVVAMRTNCGVRCSGDGSGCYIYNNEFYTGSGGASGVELQGTVSNVKVYHNYFHDISGAGGNYGAIGYPGQSPSGSGHEYYDNLIVNCTFGIKYVPSTAYSHHNIIINSGGVAGGTSSNNITSESGYTFAKTGSNGSRNTYWTVSSGSLASTFSGIKVGIDDSAGTSNPPEGGGSSGGGTNGGGGETTSGSAATLRPIFAYTISDDTASAIATGLTSGFTYEGTPGQGWSTLTGAGLKIMSGYGTQVSCGYLRYLGGSVSCSMGAINYDEAMSRWNAYLQSSVVQKNLDNIMAFALSDDWYYAPGGGKKLFQDMTASVHKYAPGHRSICIITANTSYAHSASSYANFAGALNFSPSGCDMVGLYLYPTINKQPLTNFTNAIEGLKILGLDTSVTPIIGIAESYNTTGATVEQEVRYMCDNGSQGIGFWAYNTGLGTAAAESADIRSGMAKGIEYCKGIWGVDPFTGGGSSGSSGSGSPYSYFTDANFLPIGSPTPVDSADTIPADEVEDLFPGAEDNLPDSAKNACTDIAGSAGFIPCGRSTNDPDTEWDECAPCTLCSGILMGQLVIEFMLKVAAVAAALSLIFAGYAYVFAAGKPDLIMKAKKTIRYTLIGFLIIFLAWALIDSLLTTLGYIDPISGSWYITC